jgi:hypothetical protein
MNSSQTSSNRTNAASLKRVFPGDSEMARRMRAFDWSQSDLGPPETWPQILKTSVRIALTSRHPMFVWWGERLINLYNDGCAAFLCAKHPAALGQPADTVWPEIWEQIGPRIEFAMHRDEGAYDEALPFIWFGAVTRRKLTSCSPTARFPTIMAASAGYSATSPKTRSASSVNASWRCSASWRREPPTRAAGRRRVPWLRAPWKPIPTICLSR